MTRNPPSANPVLVPDEVRHAQQMLAAAQAMVHRSYLGSLREYPVLSADAAVQDFNASSDVRIFRIERLVHENRQSMLESATAAYSALGAAGHAVFLYLRSQGRQSTDLCIGVRARHSGALGDNAGRLLQDTFRGHFAGSALRPLRAPDIRVLLDEITAEGETHATKSVTAVTGVPGLSTDSREHFVQGLERLIDAGENRVYQAILLAEPVSARDLARIRAGFEQAATHLSPLLKQQLTFGVQDSESVGRGINRSLGESFGLSLGLTETRGVSQTEGTSTTETSGTSSTTSTASAATKAAGVLSTAGTIAASIAGGPVAGLVASGVGQAITTAVAEQRSETTQQSVSESRSESTTVSSSSAESVTRSSTTTSTLGDSQSHDLTHSSTRQLSIEIGDKSIEQLLTRIDHHLERLEEARTYGGWDSAAYFIGEDRATSESLASLFLGISRGTESSHEDFALTTWHESARKPVLEWLATLMHPRLRPDFSDRIPVAHVTPATLVSGKELAIQLGLPRRSTSTVGVVETAAFGRSVQLLHQAPPAEDARRIVLGQLRHMWENLPQDIPLDLDALCAHVFVTGSTGSGKSNALYGMLDQLDKAGIRFLVVEPAKGEYKHVFGQRPGMTVLGTNPAGGRMLRINPFQFPMPVHVLEHADRLVEIFSVCWPLYAAMPAVLKDAILRAYELAGWDLATSENRSGQALFPTFTDLLEALESVVQESRWSEEVKANYLGSLSTRVKSLTNGLYGQIFSAGEIENTTLFDSNVLVDLSRVGSAETKALIMGVLVMRLSEHRVSEGGINRPLRHVTVLEEAHHILRRNADGESGVVGKAVEMLSNGIAEMRTYGEGFIIVDQSPEAVDMSAIRNTNTKIILRLPGEGDRRLVGKSVGLRDEQLEEIARLPRGVAVVYQNDWLEPVLCHVRRFAGEAQPYDPAGPREESVDEQAFRDQALALLLARRMQEPPEPDLRLIEEALARLPLPATLRIAVSGAVRQYRDDGEAELWALARFGRLARVVTDLLGCRKDVQDLLRTTGSEAITPRLEQLIERAARGLPGEMVLAAQHCLMKDAAIADPTLHTLYQRWRNDAQRGTDR